MIKTTIRAICFDGPISVNFRLSSFTFLSLWRWNGKNYVFITQKTKLYLTHKQNYIITTYIYIASVCSSVVSSYVSESIKGKVKKKISMPLQCIKNWVHIYCVIITTKTMKIQKYIRKCFSRWCGSLLQRKKNKPSYKNMPV